MRFSANLGFLWSDLPLPEAIRAAHRAGFDAVECHYPYDQDRDAVLVALRETGLPMLGLNTHRGAPGENGLLALPGRSNDARAEIDRAIAYARHIGCSAIHLMAGKAEGAVANAVYRANLTYACRAAPEITMLIEPLNSKDAPGYFLSGSAQALEIITALALPNLKLMFDCYHLQIMEGDVLNRLDEVLPHMGHVQIAAVPDRGAPDHGALDYRQVCQRLRALGWMRPIGAEYLSLDPVEDSLGWLAQYRSI